MANARKTYPDLSKPIANKQVYPDLSKPVAKAQERSEAMPGLPLRNFPFVNRPNTPEENQQVKESAQGAAQTMLNAPEEAANVFGKSMYNKFNFAPKTTAGKIGEYAGDIAQYMLPSTAVKSTLGIASMIPKAKKYVDLLSAGLKARPITNALLQGTKNAGEAALFEKEKNPKASGWDVAEAGGIGVGVPAAISAVTSANPIIALLSRLGIGGALGYQQGGVPGAMEGAGLAVTGPKILKELGIGAPPVAAEFLTQSPNALAQSRVKAGNRLGTPLRPSEAFNSAATARNEGMISRSETGGEAMSQHAENRVVQQNKAINRFLNRVYPKNEAADANIRGLYKKAYEKDLNQNLVHAMMEDPVISKAASQIADDPAFLKDLKDARMNNVGYLDQIKRKLDDMTESALRSGEKNKARIYADSSRKMTETIDKVAPEYGAARAAAQKKIIRESIEKKLGSKAVTGNNFFNKLLRNENQYKELLGDLKTMPEAQKMVKDMKLAWEHLIGGETPRSAAGSSARSMSTARNEMIELWNKYKDAIGAPRDIARANFIHDPKWWEKFDEVMAYKDKLKRNEYLGKLLARGISVGTLEKAKVNAEKNQNR